MEKIKILAVDDNSGLLDLLERYFEKSEKVEIAYTAKDGDEALSRLKNNIDNIDVVVLDLIMPNKDGISVLEEMREQHIDKKIIVQTSYDSSEMIKKVASLGANYFITKPYDVKDLEKRIVQVYSNSSESNEYSLRDGEMEVTISKWLHELGIPSHIKGYQYIRESVCCVVENPDIIGSITKTLYPELAKKFDTTVSRVERAMRHAIEVGWTRSNWKLTEDIFGQSVDFDRTKPTNSEFIVTLADKLRLDNRKVNSL